MNILMIDNSETHQNITKKYLDISHFKKIWNLDIVHNLEQSFKKLLNKKYDILLLELYLEKTKGLETISEMICFLKNQAKKNNKNIPIIILTSQEDFSIGKQALELGVSDFLIKKRTHNKDLFRSINFATCSKDLPDRPFYSRKKLNAL